MRLHVPLFAYPLLAAILPLDAAQSRPASNQAVNDFDLLIQQGRDAYDASDFSAAAASYEKACPAELIKSLPVQRQASCHHHLATISSARGEAAVAERQYLTAIEAWKQSGGAYDASHAASLMNLGELYRRLHRENDAETVFLRAADLARPLGQNRPQLLPEVLSRLGSLYHETGRFDLAKAVLAEALERFSHLTAPLPAEVAYARNAMGMVQLMYGLNKEAEANLRSAVSLASSALGEADTETASYQTNLALCLIVQGQYKSANLLLRRARLVVETHWGPSDGHMGLILAEQSAALLGDNKLGLAEECARQAIDVLGHDKDSNPTVMALVQVNLADVLLRANKLDEADRFLAATVATERQVAANTRLLADGIRRLADLRAMQHSWPQAQELYMEAITIYEKQLGPNSPALAPVLRGYAEALKHNGGSKSDVRNLESRARTVASYMPRS